MEITNSSLNRKFICINGKIGKIISINPDQSVGVIFLEPCGPYWWSKNVEYDSSGKALNESGDFDIKNWLDD